MSFDLIIKNGTVILENEARVVDIAVKGGKIAAIGQDLGDAKEVMDASGLVVSPGMVDAHTHISEPGRSHWEGYETGYNYANNNNYLARGVVLIHVVSQDALSSLLNIILSYIIRPPRSIHSLDITLYFYNSHQCP